MARFMNLSSKGGNVEYWVNVEKITWMQVLKNDVGTVLHFDHENSITVGDTAERIALAATNMTD